MEYIGNRLTGVIWIDHYSKRVFMNGVGWVDMDMLALYGKGIIS